jgi:uncharacterized protein (DUF302 family)
MTIVAKTPLGPCARLAFFLAGVALATGGAIVAQRLAPHFSGTPSASDAGHPRRYLMEALSTIPSAYGVKDTAERLEAEVTGRGMTVFARIDHAAGAATVGMDLRPTELLVFGSPRAGTPLMQQDQRVGIDLPLKALVWQDAAGRVWLSYEDPRGLADRRGLRASDPALSKMSDTLRVVANAAAGNHL